MENLKVRFFCEGVSDKKFIIDFIEVNYDKDVFSAIEVLNGYHNLHGRKLKITETFSDYTTLIFLDADDKKVTEKAGFVATGQYIDELMKTWNWVKYDKYIFPNNKDEGVIENLLEKIIAPQNSRIFDCWSNFEECLSEEGKLTLPAKKSKIYTYLECLHGVTNQEKEKCKDAKRDFTDENLWAIKNTENPYIKALKDFLDQYLQ